MAWYVWSAVSIPRTSVPPAAAGLLLVLAAVAVRATTSGPVTVWLIPGPPETPEKLTVLAPPEVLDQLDALAQRDQYLSYLELDCGDLQLLED